MTLAIGLGWAVILTALTPLAAVLRGPVERVLTVWLRSQDHAEVE